MEQLESLKNHDEDDELKRKFHVLLLKKWAENCDRRARKFEYGIAAAEKSRQNRLSYQCEIK